MNFLVERSEFIKHLQAVIGAVEKKQTLPILSHVLIELEKNSLKLTTNNLEFSLSTSIQLTNVENTGSIALQAKKLLDICKTLPPDCNLEFSLQNEFVFVSAGTSSFKLTSCSSNDFPKFTVIENNEFFDLKESFLYKILTRTYFAMAQQDVRYYLNGLLIELNKNIITMVATDGHRLALTCSVLDSPDIDFHTLKQLILPRKVVLELMRLLDSKSEESIRLEFGEEYISFISKNISLNSRLIDGKFPNYNQVIPSNNPYTLTINKELLKSGLHKASVFNQDRSKAITFNIKNDKLSLNIVNDQEEFADEIPIESDIESLSISFNIQYLLDVINTLLGDNLTIYLKDDIYGALICDVDDETAKYVVMPMRI